MICDVHNLEVFDGRPMYYLRVTASQNPLPASNVPQIDLKELMRMNLPARAPVLQANARQVLLGRTPALVSLAEEFHSLAKQWEDETSFQSSLGEKFTNEAYQRIMAMGREALPLILSELKKKPGHWFYALEKIVGRDVAADSKNYADARAAWLEWGYRQNHI